jgi:acyl-CoA thioester hydrolase
VRSVLPEHVAEHRADTASYPRWRSITLKYADQNATGEVSSTAVGRLFEEARYFARTALDVDEARDPYIGFVVASVRIDLLVPVHYPGTVDVAIGVARAGRTSFGYASGLFQDGRLVALSDAVVAVRDKRTGAGCELTAGFRRALEPMMLRTPSVRA